MSNRQEFQDSFLTGIHKQQERQTRLDAMTDKERAEIERERQKEVTALRYIVKEATGADPSWF